MPLRKTITGHGNSAALVIDRALCDMLGLKKGSRVHLHTDGRNLLVCPAGSPSRQRRLRAALERVHRQYGDVLKRLAQ